jgi:hypothetical protein
MAARVTASSSPAIPAMTFPRDTVYPRTPVREMQRVIPSDGSLADHSFQLANANPVIDQDCDNLFTGEVLFKFNSLIHQLALYGP